MKNFPMQPIVWDGKGVIRFQENRIVSALLDFASSRGMDMNEIARAARRGAYTKAEQMQFAQLIGYSVSGFRDLSYADPEVVRRADEKARNLPSLETA